MYFKKLNIGLKLIVNIKLKIVYFNIKKLNFGIGAQFLLRKVYLKKIDIKNVFF